MNPFEALSAFGEAAPILAKYGIEVQRIGLFSMIALGVKLKGVLAEKDPKTMTVGDVRAIFDQVAAALEADGVDITQLEVPKAISLAMEVKGVLAKHGLDISSLG